MLSDTSWKSGGGGYISSIADFTKFSLALAPTPHERVDKAAGEFFHTEWFEKE